MSAPTTVDIDPIVLEDIKKLRMQKRSEGNAAYIVKIDKVKLCLVHDCTESNLKSVSDLVDEDYGVLPDNTPRFVVLSYELRHGDGRVSYPLVVLNWSPATSSVEMKTLYASALTYFTNKVDIAKIIDIRDGELTEELLNSKLS